MKKLIITLVSIVALGACAAMDNTKMNQNPKTEPATKSTSQADPFQWLEDVNGERALNWVRAHNEPSLARLRGDPRYQGLENDAMAIVRATDRLTFGGFSQGYVTNFWQDASQVRGIWRRSSFASWRTGSPQWETILDIDKLARDEGKNWVYKGASCLDPNDQWNTICMISLSDGGKDAVALREFDMRTRTFVEGGFYLPEAKSDFTWVDKDTLLVSTNWGEGSLTESGYPFIVKTLKRGQPLSAAVEVFRGTRTDVSARSFRLDDGEKYHHFFSRGPTFFTSKIFYIGPNNAAQELALPSKASIVGLFEGKLYFSIEENWQPRGNSETHPSGSLLSAPLASLIATTGKIETNSYFRPSQRTSLQGASLTKTALIVEISENVKSKIIRYEFASRALTNGVRLPENGVASVIDSGMRQAEVFYSYNDLLTPPSILYSSSTNEDPRVVQSQPARFNASDLVVEQFEATSKDGTKVPYFLVHKRGIAMNSSTPTLLYGYGGFEISQRPNYSAYVGKLWLERGGAYALANIRGGGEFGPDWHQAGLKLKRQVVYDDFIAIAEDLIAKRITSPRRLGIMGGSNGGLLMGVMLTQRPELFNAAVVQVPLLDMLRYHLLLAGASWVDEYGSPDVPAERAWLEQLSPYNILRKRDDMPEPFFVTSTKDDRVHPAHARKFAAKMEELGMPFLY